MPETRKGERTFPRNNSKASNSPPFILKRSVPLPPLSDARITLHSYLEYTDAIPSIKYDLNTFPSAAILCPTAQRGNPEQWRRYPAMYPPVGSLTIRIAEVLRPIVVFPATLDDSIVTIDDVLKAVWRSVHLAAHERHQGVDVWRQAQSRNRQDSVYQNKFCTGWWWAGLYPSPEERDVWILHTQ
ncbi:hypothetical protein GALMADRAFT_1358377 [Galerina marginata CBS 339.88]|uniref:DUF6699 domain-containing protein n=1 Tax=Galerina marginata (strain CBS 339.88) TaxID=685588 RepID=A0A067TDE7_GALM3|nr:hypothetical protein GALMADRAFT_1358377 [Galerina marginata CBS 339.88]